MQILIIESSFQCAMLIPRDDSDNIGGTRPILRSQLSLGMVPPSLVRIWSIHRLVGIVGS